MGITLLGRIPGYDALHLGDALFGQGVRLTGLMSDLEWETRAALAMAGTRTPDQERITGQRFAEFLPIDMPSSRSVVRDSPVLVRAAAYEVTMREIRLLERVHHISTGLVDQAFTFRRTIQRTPSNARLGHSEANRVHINLQDQSRAVRLHAQQYNIGQERMRRLGAYGPVATVPEFAEGAIVARARFEVLRAEDIRCNTDTYDALSSGTFQLPWFWRLNARDVNMNDGDFIDSCESIGHVLTTFNLY